jgi:hypothetical protein
MLLVDHLRGRKTASGHGASRGLCRKSTLHRHTSDHVAGMRFPRFLEARVAGKVDANRADSYPARLPQDWISVNVVPQRPGSFSSTSASLRSRSSSPAPNNESNRPSRAVVN